jgi:hypothetical protein
MNYTGWRILYFETHLLSLGAVVVDCTSRTTLLFTETPPIDDSTRLRQTSQRTGRGLSSGRLPRFDSYAAY